MTPAQCRAARGLLDWTQARLAEVAGLSLSTVVKLERSGRAVAVGAVPTIKRTLESAGIEFISENGSGAGVRFRKGKLN